MTKIYDQMVSFQQGSDTGDDAPSSIQPVANNEYLWAENDGRPTENLRARTELLRRLLQDVNYFLDYGRGLLLRTDGTFTFTEPSAGEFELSLSTGSLWVVPSLTPGRSSGGRFGGGRVFCENSVAGGAWTPYSGVPGVDDLILTAHRDFTGQRGYADADSFDTTPGGISIGANRIEVSLVADPALVGGAGSISAAIEGSPNVRITITYGTNTTSTTLAELISFINSDRSSQGTYGVADFLRATSTGTTTNPPWPFADGVVQGAYDAEAHEVPAAHFTAFFAATDGGGAYVNRLREGEGLAIGYPLGPVQQGGSPPGGRRQSIWDLPTDRTGTYAQNTAPSAGWALFVTGREPEKIPGAVPIGKVVEGEFVFLDGTRLSAGETLALGESRTTYAALASQASGADGASLVGYHGGAPWNADTTPPTNATLPDGHLAAILTLIATTLTLTTTLQSGARRIGGEAQTATTSTGQEHSLALTAGSLREQMIQLLQGVDGSSRIVGINGRVQEDGHFMKGAKPLQKNFGQAGMPAGGAEFLRATFHAPGNLMSPTPVLARDRALLTLMPVVYSLGATDNATATETGVLNNATSLVLTSMTSTRFGNVFAKLPVVLDTLSGTSAPMVYALLTGLSGASDAPDGLYVVHSVSTGSQVVVFRKLDGSSPTFTGMLGSATVTLYIPCGIGSDHRGTRLHWSVFAPDAATFDPLGNVGGIIGASSVDAPLLKFFTANTSTNAGTLQCVVFADRMLWAGDRSTHNILQAADKNLLDGQEDHLTVDATTNHHHGGNYTRTRFLASTAFVNHRTDSDVNAFPLNGLAGHVCSASPSNHTRVAVILKVSIQCTVNAAANAGDEVLFRVAFWSTNPSAGSPHAIVEVNTQLQAAPGAAIQLRANAQITVPTEFVTPDDYFYFAVTGRTGLAGGAGSELVTIQEIGGVFAQADAVV